MFCEAGHEAAPRSDECTPCNKGYYKEVSGNSPCEQCPIGANGINEQTTTNGTGADNITLCNIGKFPFISDS